jgi:hypothetical protein
MSDRQIIRAPRRRLVFTSAGADADLSRWLETERSFDVWVAYRGQGEPPWRREVDRFERSSAAKFPAFKRLHAESMDLLRRYDAVFLLDDDIEISAAAIEQLFAIRDRFDLWILQPSYSRASKISHVITLQDGRGKLRFTNFVEVGVPLFQRSRLDDFMAVYDPALVGYGVDWWYLDHLGPDLSRRVAIVDDVACVNPPRKSGSIEAFQPRSERVRTFLEIKARHGITADDRYRQEIKLIGHAPHGVAWL